MKKFIAIFKYSLKMNTTFFLNYMFRIFSFMIHVLVFNSLWDFILKDGSLYGYNKQEMILYVILTEFMTYGSARFYDKISNMVKDGTISNMLIRPMNFLAYFAAEDSANIVKIFVNAVVATVLIVVYCGTKVFTATGILLGMISCLLGFIVAIFIQLILGLVAFYIEETKSVWFILQKLQFLLVFVPIEFYGEIVQKLLMLLPTTHVVYSPAKIFVDYQIAEGFGLIGMQILMIGLLMMVTCIMYKKGVKKINVNGG